MSQQVQVYVRVKPPQVNNDDGDVSDECNREQQQTHYTLSEHVVVPVSTQSETNNEYHRVISVHHPTANDKAIRKFMFDKIFGPALTQKQVFEHLGGPLIDHVFLGISAFLFAYGPTESGKSYSLFGENYDVKGENRGIIAQTVQSIFEQLGRRTNYARSSVTVSLYQVCKDHIADIGRVYMDEKSSPMTLSSRSLRRNAEYSFPSVDLEMSENGEISIAGVAQVKVRTVEDVLEFLEQSLWKWRSSNTSRLTNSSTMFSITVTQYARTNKSSTSAAEGISGTLTFIDLPANNQDDEYVQKNLSELKMLISRDNRSSSNPCLFTRVLQSQLNAQSLTSVLVQIDPTSSYTDTISTCTYAAQCKRNPDISNISSSDLNIVQKEKRIQELEKEVDLLQKELFYQQRKMLQENEELQETIRTMTKTMTEFAINRPFVREKAESDDKSPNKTRRIDEQDRLIERMGREKASISMKLDSRDQSIAQLQQALLQEEMNHKKTLHSYRQQVQSLKKENDELKVKLKRDVSLAEENHRKEVENLKDGYQGRILELTTLVDSIPDKMLSKYLPETDNAEVSILRRDLERKFTEAVKFNEESNQSALNELKDMYEALLTKKDNEILSLQLQHKQYEEKVDIEKANLEDEVTSLYLYSKSLSHVLSLLAQTKHVKHSFSTTKIQLFDKDEPEPTRTQILPVVKAKLKNCSTFLVDLEDAIFKEDSRLKRSMSVKIDSESLFSLDNVERTERLRKSRPVTSHSYARTPDYSFRQVDSRSSVPSSPMHSKSSLGGENDLMKNQFLREQKKNADLRIAFDALKRENERLRSVEAGLKREKARSSMGFVERIAAMPEIVSRPTTADVRSSKRNSLRLY